MRDIDRIYTTNIFVFTSSISSLVDGLNSKFLSVSHEKAQTKRRELEVDISSEKKTNHVRIQTTYFRQSTTAGCCERIFRVESET